MPVDKSEVTLHRAVVNRWIEAFNTHNVAAIVALYAHDAELYDSGMKHPRRGRTEIERWFTTRFQSLPSISYTPLYQFYSEEQAAVSWTVRGQGPRILGQVWLSRPFQVNGVSIFSLQGGLIENQHGYYDHLSALEQILPPIKWILPRRL